MKIKEILISLLFAILLIGCGGGGNSISGSIGGEDDPTTQPPGQIDHSNINANIGGERYSTRIEIPHISDDDIFATRTTTANGKEQITYSVSHNMERKHSRWVAFTFDASNRAIKWDRDDWGKDPFQADPDHIGDYVMTSEQINRNGYQRGHLVASYDRVYSKDANEQTFYFSNISPMLGGFNTGLWNELEYKINKRWSGWGGNKDFADTLYIVKGGTIAEGQYTTRGTCPTVPKHYFMALLRLYKGAYYGIAFLFEHKSYLPGTVADYAITIDELEEFTGIDFFCNLKDRLENAVESTTDKKTWGL